MTAQITLTQQSDGTWMAAIADGDETISFTGAAATITPYVAPVVTPTPTPTPAPVSTTYAVPVAPNAKTSTLTHAVHAEINDGVETWTFDTFVGDDPTQAGIYGGFFNAAGKSHPGIVAKAYADCIDVGAMRMDNGADYLGCTLAVTYDGAAITIPYSDPTKIEGLKSTDPGYLALNGSNMNFWVGCCTTVRYGAQVGWSAANIDWSVLPSYSVIPPQTAYNESGCNYTANGFGCSTVIAMSNSGERPDIGFLPGWDVGFVNNPSDASWAVVRRASDFAGQWRVHYVHPETGKIVRITDFPQANLLPPADQNGFPDNPIVKYTGSYTGATLTPAAGVWKTSGTPNSLSTEHPTGYCFLSAMVTRTARDLDHASFWGNYSVINWNPAYYAKSGVKADDQRAYAWNLRSIFLAAYHSSDTDYFAPQLEQQLTLTLAWLAANQNPYGLLDYTVNRTYTGPQPPPDPDLSNVRALPVWQSSYIMLTLDAVAHKDQRWLPFQQFVGTFYVLLTNSYMAPLGTTYITALTLNDAVITEATTLQGLAKIYYYTLMMDGYTLAQAESITASTNTLQDTYNAIVAANTAQGKHWDGKFANGVSDMIGDSQVNPSGYPAMWQMAVVSAYNAKVPGADKALAYIEAMPTKTDYTGDGKYHLVPRA